MSQLGNPPRQYEYLLFALALLYALYWQSVTPIQFSGDSEGYLGLAHMLLGQSSGMPPIFRTPGYPILLILTGAVVPGTFLPLVWVQAFLAAIVPPIIYRILLPYGRSVATLAALVAIFTGTTSVHTSQVMSEPLFTCLLFVGLGVAVKIIRSKNPSTALFCGLAFVFAALNTVRPIAWPIFWMFLIISACAKRNRAATVRERVFLKPLASALLFMTLMSLWGIADDVLLSNGARYSPLAGVRSPADSSLESYLYSLPFMEEFFSPWAKQVAQLSSEQIRTATSAPSYLDAQKTRIMLEKNFSKEARIALYAQIAKESGRNWPKRWLALWQRNPFLSFTGPSHGNGPQYFLLAYTSLRHYATDAKGSLIDEANGPATRFLFTTLKDTLKLHADLWRGTPGLLGTYSNNPEGLSEAIKNNPNQRDAWEIAVMLWDTMGYDTMSQLLTQVAHEAFVKHKIPLIHRMWDTMLMFAAGPGYIEFDTLSPQFGQVEIYDYLETPQLSQRQKNELHATQKRYQPPYLAWQAPIRAGYFLFYLLKPLFFLTSILSLALLWVRHYKMFIPCLLMLPYFLSIVIYGAWFTALPRYTDPTLLLPFMLTCMAIPECRRNKTLPSPACGRRAGDEGLFIPPLTPSV